MDKGVLYLDEKRISYAKSIAEKISKKVFDEIKNYSTTSIERSILRLLNISKVNEKGVPFVNLFVDKIKNEGLIKKGVLFIISNGL
ncbi:MAG: D-lysine 5,6-aminomutase subunit alpha, partial [Caldisericia bacterium]|nr:D-lysine 5,6-aminomutase subunit alpha [Caldisericia bacterium]